MVEEIKLYLQQVKETLEQLPLDRIQQVITILRYARQAGKQVFILGNGGSAATASHFACDLAKNTTPPGQPRLRVLALTDNMPLFSALANDSGYESVFSEQLTSFLQPGDVVIGISGSGNSANVLHAISLARSMEAITIGFTGFDGGQLKDVVDICILVPNYCMEQVEDIHLLLEHLICTVTRQELSRESASWAVNWLPSERGQRVPLEEPVLLEEAEQ